MKKKRLKDEKLEREYPEVWSDFSLEVVDKTLVNMFDNLGKNDPMEISVNNFQF